MSPDPLEPDPVRVTGHGDVFVRYPIWDGGRMQMGGYNHIGLLELFDKSKYAQWMKENLVGQTR